MRKALSALKKEGLIERKGEQGGFITAGQGRLEPMTLTGMIEDISRQRRK